MCKFHERMIRCDMGTVGYVIKCYLYKLTSVFGAFMLVEAYR